MPGVTPTNSPAGVLTIATPANNAHLSRLHKIGRAPRLAKGIYAVDATLPVEALARHHLWRIIAHHWPGAVVCDRTAFDYGHAAAWIFICHPDPPRKSDLALPGITVSCRVGPGPLPGDNQWMEVLHISGPARSLLENADDQGRPPTTRPARAAGMEAVGDKVDEFAASGGGSALRSVFAVFDQIRGHFNPAAAARVKEILTAASGTAVDTAIASDRLSARLSGSPHDQARVDLFVRAGEELAGLAPIVRPDNASPGRSQWLPFFEAYFSNYIEGTRFSVEEAYAIAIDHRIPQGRPQDAHDVSATFQIVSDPATMAQVPRDADDLLELLRDRHHVLMSARPDKRPGQFKNQPNYAGATVFVAPEQVEGTLRAGWDILNTSVDPFHRAVMMMFLVSECHPFDDGNGRVARILTNAELVARGQQRIVITNSYRNNYLAALSGATAGNGVAGLTSVLDFARRWVAAVDWSAWERCRTDLDDSNAFEDPGVAEHSGNRLRLPGTPQP